MNRAERIERMRSISERVAEIAKHKNPTQVQELEFNSLNGEFRELEIENVRAAAMGEDGGRTENGTNFGPGNGAGFLNRDNASEAKRLIERSVSNGSLPDYAAERATELITTGSDISRKIATRWVTSTGNDNYLSAFAKLVSDPERGHLLWDAKEQAAYQEVNAARSEMRSMSLTDSAGGYMVPFQLDPSIILTNSGTINPLRAISKVVRATGDVWNGVSSLGVTAEWLDEGAEAAGSDPVLVQPAIPNYKGAVYLEYSYEVGMDAANFLTEMAKLLHDGAERLESTAFTTGSGVDQPTGIVTALAASSPTVLVAPTVAETYTAADLYKLQNALPARYQANAKWMGSLAIANSTDQFETTNGSKKFPDMGSATPFLLRHPYFENSEMDNVYDAAATAANYVLIYGDFQNFVITDRIGSTIELIPNVMGANRRPVGKRGLFLWFRTGSDSVNDSAFRMLNVATTA